MNLQERKEILVRLGQLMQTSDQEWEAVKERAAMENGWFTPAFVALSANAAATEFLSAAALDKVIEQYAIPEETKQPKTVGIVMAGNLPMVGFHDLLCTFLTGHYAAVKLSSKDAVLIKFLAGKLIQWNEAARPYFTFSEMLKGCDAYIATGSNNTANYFEFYFSKYPHIIRKNRTSVAVLTGEETDEHLAKLADDVYQYFGLGCRNVTKIYVPRDFNFERLLNIFSKYNDLANHQKYKNNYDYNLAIYLLNNRYFMSNESLLLVEDTAIFSPISQLNYEYYDDVATVYANLKENESVQCIVGAGNTAFGSAQTPGFCDFADGVDTLKFLLDL